MHKKLFVLTVSLILLSSYPADAVSFLDVEVRTSRFLFWDIHDGQYIDDSSIISGRSMSASAITSNSYSYSEAGELPSQVSVNVPHATVSATLGPGYGYNYDYANIELSADRNYNPFSADNSIFA